MLKDKLQTDLNDSLKKGNTVRVETIRFLLAGIRNAGITKYGVEADKKLTDEDIMDVVKRQVKTHKESVEAFSKAGRTDLVEKEKAQLAVLMEYAPKELSDEDLKSILTPIIATGETNFGLLMKQAMAAVNGQADGGRVSGMIKQLLPSN